MLVARTGALGVGHRADVEAIRRERADARPRRRDDRRSPGGRHAARPARSRSSSSRSRRMRSTAALERVEADALDGAVVLPLLNGLEHVEAIRGSDSGRASSSRGASAASKRSRRSRASSSSGARRPRRSPPRPTSSTETRWSARSSRFACRASRSSSRDGERRVLWEKAARLAVLAAAAIASGLPVGELRDDPAWRRRLEAALAEACAVAEEDGVELDAASAVGDRREPPREPRPVRRARRGRRPADGARRDHRLGGAGGPAARRLDADARRVAGRCRQALLRTP